MKINTNINDVKHSGTLSERKFTIKESAKAFDILSSKLYNHPVLAVVRETSTNAYDSQVEAGNKDLPFLVNLPTYGNPVFSVRDYGTGLSKNDIENIWTTYFESTRTGSNTFVGCLGLGSKSPFSYTDQFVVTSYFNRTKYVFSAFKNKDGEPSISLLSETATSEPNGLEIRVPVKSSDFYEFQEATKSVYNFFDVRPIIQGELIKFDTFTPIISTSDYQLYLREYPAPTSFPIVLKMGQIAYQIEDTQGLVDMYEFRQHACLVINGDIGDFAIAANREQLHLDKDTARNVDHAISCAIADIKVRIQANMDSKQTFIEKMQVAEFAKKIGINGLYHGIVSAERAYSLKECRFWQSGSFQLREFDKLYPKNNIKYTFIEKDVEDVSHTLRRRLALYCTTNPNEHVYLAEIADKDEFIHIFGTPTKLTDLPAAPRTQRQRNASYLTGVRELVLSDTVMGSWASIMWPSHTNRCKVIREDNYVHYKGQRIEPRDAFNLAKIMGYDCAYGVSVCKSKQYSMPELYPTAEKLLTDLIAKLTTHELCYLAYNDQIFNVMDFANIDKNTSQTIKDMILALTPTENVEKVQKLMKHFPNIQLPVATTNYFEAFFKKYPLLRYVSARHIIDRSMIDYINLVEKS